MLKVGALCHQLNPELNQEFLINGNNFLTSFYKLSRIHEKILLGMPTSEDIHSASVLKLATDFEILPADRPRSTIEKSGRISELAKCPSIDKVIRIFLSYSVYGILTLMIVDCNAGS